jgi:hypothetical protein
VRIIIECPERILHLEAGYIYADCTFAQLQTSCSSVADHTLSVIEILQQLSLKWAFTQPERESTIWSGP